MTVTEPSMRGKTILVVEDEKPIRDLLRFSLEREGFQVEAAEDAAAARLCLAEQRPDLVLIDWMMPVTSGLEFARELKAAPTFADIPLIMLTARGEEGDKVKGLNIGCDDYVTKPFSTAELVARISAVLRRTVPGGSDERIEFGGIEINVAAQRVEASGQSINLGPTEYRLLHFFTSHPERVYSREQLLDRIWGQNVYIEERTVDVHIRRLRKALAPAGKDNLIQTVRGTGYRFSATPG